MVQSRGRGFRVERLLHVGYTHRSGQLLQEPDAGAFFVQVGKDQEYGPFHKAPMMFQQECHMPLADHFMVVHDGQSP